MKFQPSVVISILSLFGVVGASAATISYEFTGGGLNADLVGVPAGVTVTPITIGGGLNLSGGTDALRFEAADTQDATGTATTNQQWLRFDISIAAGTVVNLTAFQATYTTTLDGNFYSNSRLFSSIDGFDSAVNDTIGIIGKQSPNPTGGPYTNSFNLTNPAGNIGRGSNVNAGDFSNLTNTTVTFYIPWVDNGSGTYYTDLDRLQVDFDVVPEPSSILLGAIGLLPLLRRSRKSH